MRTGKSYIEESAWDNIDLDARLTELKQHMLEDNKKKQQENMRESNKSILKICKLLDDVGSDDTTADKLIGLIQDYGNLIGEQERLRKEEEIIRGL